MTQAQTNLVTAFSILGSAIVLFLVLAIISMTFYKFTRRFDLSILVIAALTIFFGFMGFGWVASLVAGVVGLLLFIKYFRKKSEKLETKK